MKFIELWNELEGFAIQFSESRKQIELILKYYQDNCEKLIQEFRNISFSDSKVIFTELFNIQDHISYIKYKYNIEMSDFLENFIYYFDRQDEFNEKFLYENFHKSSNWPS